LSSPTGGTYRYSHPPQPWGYQPEKTGPWEKDYQRSWAVSLQMDPPADMLGVGAVVLLPLHVDTLVRNLQMHSAEEGLPVLPAVEDILDAGVVVVVAAAILRMGKMLVACVAASIHHRAGKKLAGADHHQDPPPEKDFVPALRTTAGTTPPFPDRIPTTRPLLVPVWPI